MWEQVKSDLDLPIRLRAWGEFGDDQLTPHFSVSYGVGHSTTDGAIQHARDIAERGFFVLQENEKGNRRFVYIPAHRVSGIIIETG